MKSIFDNFTHCYKISKTLRFSLIPQYETLEYIKKDGIIDADKKRASDYVDAKPVLDLVHKNFINEALSDYKRDWSDLYGAVVSYRKSKSEDDKKKLEDLQDKIQNEICSYLTKNSNYKVLKPKDIVENAVKHQEKLSFLDAEQIKKLKAFDKFTTYFEGYRENRENIYKPGISTSVAYRIVVENFPKYVSNLILFKCLDKSLKDEFIEKSDCDETLFEIDGFNNVLTQDGIGLYNNCLGGNNEKDNKKLQGLNELCNLAFQQGKLEKKVKFMPLYKQILSDRSSLSFVIDSFDDIGALTEAVKDYHNHLDEYLTTYNAEMEFIFDKRNIDMQQIYVDNKQITTLSQIVCDGKWSAINDAFYDASIKKQNFYTLQDIKGCMDVDILKLIKDKYTVIKSDIYNKYNLAKEDLSKAQIEDYTFIKDYLDSVQSLEKLLKIFVASDDLEKDTSFYGIFEKVYSVLRENISLYNKVRNYATKKKYSDYKFKLNFDCPTLANGWDANKEYDNNVQLFKKDSKYYIAIINKNRKKNYKNKILEQDGKTGYLKLNYKLLPGPNKMLPKVFFSASWRKDHEISAYIDEGYKNGKHKKENFDLDFCHDLIDFFKDSINIHQDWVKFNFNFSETSSYADISAFYQEVEEQGYKVEFSYVDEQVIREAIANGEIYFFELYNKDFSKHSTGAKNLHTIYWESLFSCENLKNSIYKLNGGAELFYRPASILNPFVHKKDSILIKKTTKDGKTVGNELYQSALSAVSNGMDIETIKKAYPTLEFRLAPHDITKDKRFSKDSFAFHVPITINCDASKDKFPKFNEDVLKTINNNPNVNIIGIDRGERNLIYVSCINQKGEIIEQKSFNIVNGIDYHSKLDTVEKQRLESRQNWKTIAQIKDLKRGYLSGVIYEIVDMMLKHNAILIMEDLNFGFKRGRYHIEKQVYQNFEKMLIDKLNLLVRKDFAIDAPGGVRNAYQLTKKFESFTKLGKQSGFLFYLPASYTSKIDPRTGFVNLFSTRQLRYKSVQASKEFVDNFDNIYYNEIEDYFVFEFKYSDFGIRDYTNQWQVCTCGKDRISHTVKDGYDSMIKLDITYELKNLFKQNGIDANSTTLKDDILNIQSTSFFKSLLWLFKVTVQLRYEDSDNDFILSPIKSSKGFFDSRVASTDEPLDGDANGAYHIALQGLRMLKERIKDGKILSDKSGEQLYNWLKFTQSRNDM